MNPHIGYRAFPSNDSTIFEKKQTSHYARISLSGFETGTIAFFKQFGNFYKCNFSRDTFNDQVSIYKEEALKLFRSNFNSTIEHKAYLHRKIRLCEIAVSENWHSPIFVIKANSKIIATTGHNKIYATALRKQNYNLDFDCFVLDLDDDLSDAFINIKEIYNDEEFGDAIGSHNFGIDISFEKSIVGYIPSVMQFSKEYPIAYHNGSFRRTTENKEFFDKVSNNQKITIEVHDKHSSSIYDTSGIFDINYAETLVNVSVSTDVRKLNVSSRSAMRFVTFSSIQFDLADLLPYFKKSMTIYTGNDNSFVAFTNDQEPNHAEQIVCPSAPN